MFRFSNLDENAQQQLQLCARILHPSFRSVYQYVSNNYLYSLLEDNLLTAVSHREDKLIGGEEDEVHLYRIDVPEGFPPKVLCSSISSSSNNKVFEEYTSMDLRFVNSMHPLSEEVKLIVVQDTLTQQVERLLRSRKNAGFLKYSELATYDSLSEEEEEEEEEEAEQTMAGGARRAVETLNKLVWRNDPAYLPLYRKKFLISNTSIKESEKLDLTTQQLYFKNVPVYFNANDIQTLKKRTYTT